MTYLETIIKAMTDLGGVAKYNELYERISQMIGHELSDGMKAGIRKCIEDHSSDSRNYKGKQDIFYSIHGKGQGVWGIRKVTANKYQVIIRETVEQSFAINANSENDAVRIVIEKYRNGDIVLEPGELIDVQFSIDRPSE